MIDLFRPYMSPFARERVLDVLTPDPETGRLYIGQGKQVGAFEDALKSYLRSPNDVLTLNSCTSALDLALHLCGLVPPEYDLSPGFVISTPITCTATNSPIVTRGGRIVWADVDPLTGLIDPTSVAEEIHHAVEKPKAIMAVDWGGALCNYELLNEIGGSEGIPVIQDAAHSFGTQMYGVPFMADAGGHGAYTCLSFQAIKTLTTGDGGALICPNAETTERARLLRWYGLDRSNGDSFRCQQRIEEVGYKYHMNDIAAAMGLANLPHVERLLSETREVAVIYRDQLTHLNGRGIILPSAPKGQDSAWWLYTLLVSDRDAFQAFMADRGIMTSPVHARNDRHPAFFDATVNRGDGLPGVTFFAEHEVAIPVGWWLSTEEIEHIVEAVTKWATFNGRAFAPPKRR